MGNIETLEFNNVRFKHQTAQQHALANISFKAKTGETVAFVGPSGSGKTTLVKLLVGLYRPDTEGKILYNNIDGKDIDFDDCEHRLDLLRKTPIFCGNYKREFIICKS